MIKRSVFALASVIYLFTASTGFCESTDKAAGAQGAQQDTAKAVEYFESALNFTTNPYGVKRLLDEKSNKITIVDVRAAKAYAKGHIPGAINIPYDQYNSFEGNEAEFPGLSKDGYNYVYCYEHLCNLSQKAAKKFASLGYPVKEIVGGFDAWKEHKYPVEKK